MNYSGHQPVQSGNSVVPSKLVARGQKSIIAKKQGTKVFPPPQHQKFEIFGGSGCSLDTPDSTKDKDTHSKVIF